MRAQVLVWLLVATACGSSATRSASSARPKQPDPPEPSAPVQPADAGTGDSVGSGVADEVQPPDTAAVEAETDPEPLAAPPGDPCEGLSKLLKTNLMSIHGEPDESSSRSIATYRLPGLPGQAYVFGRESYAVAVYDGRDAAKAESASDSARATISKCPGWRARPGPAGGARFVWKRTRAEIVIERTELAIDGSSYSVEVVFYPTGAPRN